MGRSEFRAEYRGVASSSTLSPRGRWPATESRPDELPRLLSRRGQGKPDACRLCCARGEQQAALSDARQIIEAKHEADNWMSVMLLGFLASMHKPDLSRLRPPTSYRQVSDSGGKPTLLARP